MARGGIPSGDVKARLSLLGRIRHGEAVDTDEEGVVEQPLFRVWARVRVRVRVSRE